MARDSTIGTIYLLLFSEPLAHAQHYLGWAIDAHARIDGHLAGRGARITAAAVARGIHIELVRTWEGVDREVERQLKNGGTSKRLCPLCVAEYNARCRDRMRLHRLALGAGDAARGA